MPKGRTTPPDELERFLAAQEGVFDSALGELRRGRKRSHWMWFMFPQLRGLGRSETAWRYGLDGAEEAAAYLGHPVLGPRLTQAAEAMLAHRGVAPEAVLGPVDALKLRSSASLFAAVPGAPEVFAGILAAFYGRQPCPRTLAMLSGVRDGRS
ncbi:DUF1810 domain-containing protein [Rhodobacteraceae bacterium CCMM004]|nr:DUF1810 domain-containing protein [Rhodobacteraceae bacterium CCMM004]